MKSGDKMQTILTAIVGDLNQNTNKWSKASTSLLISLGILPVSLEVRDASFHLIIVGEERMGRQFMNCGEADFEGVPLKM